jgi:hypothetical protein
MVSWEMGTFALTFECLDMVSLSDEHSVYQKQYLDLGSKLGSVKIIYGRHMQIT